MLLICPYIRHITFVCNFEINIHCKKEPSGRILWLASQVKITWTCQWGQNSYKIVEFASLKEYCEKRCQEEIKNSFKRKNETIYLNLSELELSNERLVLKASVQQMTLVLFSTRALLANLFFTWNIFGRGHNLLNLSLHTAFTPSDTVFLSKIAKSSPC